MIIADYFNVSQKIVAFRLWIALPLFILSVALTQIDFTILWCYFTWANQSTAVIALFVALMYLFVAKKNYWIALIPVIFMLMATMSYILNAGIGFGFLLYVSYIVSLFI